MKFICKLNRILFLSYAKDVTLSGRKHNSQSCSHLAAASKSS